MKKEDKKLEKVVEKWVSDYISELDPNQFRFYGRAGKLMLKLSDGNKVKARKYIPWLASRMPVIEDYDGVVVDHLTHLKSLFCWNGVAGISWYEERVIDLTGYIVLTTAVGDASVGLQKALFLYLKIEDLNSLTVAMYASIDVAKFANQKGVGVKMLAEFNKLPKFTPNEK